MKDDADLIESLLDALQSGELHHHAQSDLDNADAVSVPATPPCVPSPRPMIPYRQRLRQSRLTQPICSNCKGENFVTVLEGSVCSDCAVYVCGSNVGYTEAHLSWDRLKNGRRHRRHVYKRRVHFCNFLRQLQGDTNIMLDDDEYSAFMLEIGTDCSITPDSVLHTLQRMNWCSRFRKHRYTLARQLGDWKPVILAGEDYFTLLRLFVDIERVWDRDRAIRGTRKTFFSYPFLFTQLCKLIGHPEYTRDVVLLKGAKQLDNQYYLWRRMCRRMRRSLGKSNTKYTWY